jgi:hypothetical protein
MWWAGGEGGGYVPNVNNKKALAVVQFINVVALGSRHTTAV